MRSDFGKTALMICLSFFAARLSAFQIGDLDLRTQSELAWQYTPARADTAFNPGGRIVGNPEHAGFLGLRVTPKFGYESIKLRGDFWLQSRVTSTETQENFYVQKSAFDWYAADTLVVSGGVDIQHWGPGYIWNPANPFQDREINFEDRVIAYKRQGNPFASVEWNSEDGWNAALYFVRHKPRDKLYGLNVPYQSAVAAKLSKQFASSDFSFTYALLDDVNFLGATYSMTVGDKLELHGELSLRDRRRTVLPQAAAPAPDQRLFYFQNRNDVDWRGQLLIGGQYTTENQINFILEYLYNGEGYSNREFDRLTGEAGSAGAQLAGDSAAGAAGFLGIANTLLGSMKRHYLFARVADTHLVDDVEAKAFVRLGLQDASVIAGGLLSYPIRDGFTLSLGGQYYGNAGGSETAQIPFRFVLYSGFSLLF